jgi:hypothetical protein
LLQEGGPACCRWPLSRPGSSGSPSPGHLGNWECERIGGGSIGSRDARERLNLHQWSSASGIEKSKSRVAFSADYLTKPPNPREPVMVTH